MDERATLIASIPFFEEMPRADIEALTAALTERTYGAGQFLCRLGEHGDEMFIVEDGRLEVCITNGKERTFLMSVIAGQYTGELSLFDKKPRSADVVATEDTRVLVLDRDALYDHIRKRPEAALAILAELGERLRNMNELISKRTARNVQAEIESKLSIGDRVADTVASFGGSWTFILTFTGLLGVWILFNSVAPDKYRFDLMPFILLNLILSVTAAMQAPVIMMSQNRQSKKDRAQAQNDYEVNLKNEIGIEELKHMVADLKQQLAQTERRLVANERLRSS
jgi:uncharacterized membrane protein